MKPMRILYRVRQFMHTIFVRVDPSVLEQAEARLSPPQLELFRKLQPSEQSHALAILNRLMRQGESQPDLLVAALLHDVGKLRNPLNPFERAMLVVARRVMPEQTHKWGVQPAGRFDTLPRWHKAFIVAEQHAAWGAEMAHQAGVSPLAETLIREHHHYPRQNQTPEGSLLIKLWAVDNEF